MKEKIKLVYLPFLWIDLGCLVGYTFLNWLLFIHWQLGPVTEEIRNIWGPMCAPLIPLIIWLRPRLKLLKFRDKAKDPVFACLFFAAFAIAAPVFVAQAYIETATGKLTSVNRIEEIGNQPSTKYYSAQHYFIDTLHKAAWLTRTVRGKMGADLDLDFYIVCPVYSADDQAPPYGPGGVKITPASPEPVTIGYGTVPKAALSDSIVVDQPRSQEAATPSHSYRQPVAWIAVKFYKRIRNRTEGKQEKILAFKKESWADYRLRPLSGFTYFERIDYSDDYIGYQSALGVLLNEEVTGNHTIFLKPATEPFSAKDGQKLPWILWSFLIGAALWFLVPLFAGLKEPAANNKTHSNPGTGGTISELIDHIKSGRKGLSFLFIPRNRFFITPLIIDLNVLLYLAMAFSGLGWLSVHAASLVEWGGNWGPATRGEGQWWRLLTSTFLHAGLLHIFMNLLALLFVGIFLEPVLGRKKYLLAYLGTGVLASLASMEMHPQVVSVGASGAIFGLYGVMIAFLLKGVFPAAFKKGFLMSMLLFVGYNLVVGLQDGVDNAAHVGGLVSGFLAGLLLKPDGTTQASEKSETA